MLGTTLLFWGAMTGRPLIGLLCALFVEGSHWVRLRWNFNDSSYESAWQLSFILMVLTSVVIWLDESRYTAVLVMMGWLPPILIPLQFVQSYGMRDSVQLTAFSLLARRSRLRSERLGLIHQSVAFNFGNVTFIVTLLSTAVAMKVESALYLPGLVVLSGWMLIASGRCRFASLTPLLVVCGGLAVAGQQGLEELEKWVRRGGIGQDGRFNPNMQDTRIGQRGQVLLSPEVMWRLTTKQGQLPPPLLSTATFSNFVGLKWRNMRSTFAELDTRYVDGARHFIINEKVPQDDIRRSHELHLRGSVDKSFAMPLPVSVLSMEGLGDAQVEKNLVGTVQVEPEASVVDAKVRWLSGIASSRNMDVNDFHIAAADEEVVKQVAEQLDLRELADLQSKLRRLKKWYHDEFRYTLDLTIRQSTPIGRSAGDNAASALEQFLTEVRAGHCEYFATSATLILRASGVAARYTTGFGVMEKSDNENQYLLRGTHAHAWVRVWDEQKQTWLDFDPTPPDWMEGDLGGLSWSQKIKDGLKRIREDFFLWRTNPDNEMVVVIVVSVFAIGLGFVVIRRLWRSRSRLEEASRMTAFGGIQQNTPLHDLESLVRRCVGQRPAGMTYVRWLRAVEDESGKLKGLNEAIRLHQQWRFDTKPVGKADQQRLRELVESLEHALRCKLSERKKT